MTGADEGGTPPERRLARVALSAGLLLVSTALSLGLAELALRVIAPQSPSWLAIYRRHPELPFHALMPDANALVDTGETRWTVITDSDGFRIGDERPASARCTALWLGDSFAFGHGVDYADSIVGRVQVSSPEVLEVNTAAPGYGPVQYRELLELAFRQARTPEFVYVVTYVGNDFHDAVWDKDVAVHEGILGHGGDLKSWLKTHLHLYRLASSALHRFAPGPETPFEKMFEELADANAWSSGFLAGARQTYAREMARILEVGRAHGAQVRFVILPTQAAVAAASAGAAVGEIGDPRRPVREAEEILRGIGADFIDVTQPLADGKAEALFLPFDGHLTPEGNAIVAARILEAWPPTCRDAEGLAK